jgi:signal transduction histidine kinase
MAPYLIAAAAVLADTGLLVAAQQGAAPVWAVAGYAVAAAGAVALRRWSPVAAFAAAVVLALLSGAGFAMLLWSAYHAGRAVVSRTDAAIAAGAVLGGLGAQVAARGFDTRAVPAAVATSVVFAILPLLVGRYLAQQERLVAALDEHNRQLRRHRQVVAEQERLRERLRIARDMHDSLGHRLSLVSIQAAALEVAGLEPRHQEAVGQLARAARGAMTELYDLVGALRGPDADRPGVAGLGALLTGFRAAGLPVTLRERGRPRPLTPAAGEAVYRVVEEGLTNAAKHAAGERVTVDLEWERDAVLLTVANRVRSRPAGATAAAGGHGLPGLAERVRLAGGFLDHGPAGDRFRLVAMLPAVHADTGPPAELAGAGRLRPVVLAAVIAGLMFMFLPLSLLTGVG